MHPAQTSVSCSCSLLCRRLEQSNAAARKGGHPSGEGQSPQMQLIVDLLGSTHDTSCELYNHLQS